MSSDLGKNKARARNIVNMLACSPSLCVDTWSDGWFPARPGFGWPNWSGGFLRMKGWVDGGKDLSGETDGKQVIQTKMLSD